MPTVRDIAPHIGFGTSGVRALVTDLTDRVVYAFSAAFLSHLRGTGQLGDAKRVILAHDLRPSSPDIAAACTAAITAAGLTPEYIGAVPTPALALRAQALQAPGIMVTGSHIPFDRNGIKFYTPGGEILKADETGMLAAPFTLPDPTAPHACRQALPEADPQALADYRQRYLDYFGTGWLTGQRIGLYQHSSVARDLLADLLNHMGATVIPLGRSDQFVPIDTEAVSQADLDQARVWCQTHHLDAVLSTDGDADRPLMFDETGAFLRGDIIGILTAQHLGAQAVATPVSSNTALEKCGKFAAVRRTRIGSPYVIEAMQDLARRHATVAGFEANGGFLLGTPVPHQGHTLAPLPTRDALLPMLCMLALAQQTGQPLSKLPGQLPPRYTASDRLRDIAPALSARFIQTLAQDPQARQEHFAPLGRIAAIDQTDGYRVSMDNGDIVHYRPSGNAPELRCYAESDTPDRANQRVTWGLKAIATYLSAATDARRAP